MVNSVKAPLNATVLAPAKVNLRLRITGRRGDGYHLLESVMVPVSLFDRLSIRVLPAAGVEVGLTCNVPDLPVGDENLVVRAIKLFLRRTDRSVDVFVKLTKSVPVGAGLGGGSSDAAAALLGLNRLLDARVPEERLMAWAAELGADVPFFIYGRPARVSGAGEVVEDLGLCCPWSLVIAFPGEGLSTKAVYQAYDATLTKPSSASNLTAFASAEVPVQELLVNDLEAAAIRIYPPVGELKQQLLEMGALGALMTGSGSAVFGVWERQKEACAAAEAMQERGIWARAVEILDRTPEIEYVTAHG